AAHHLVVADLEFEHDIKRGRQVIEDAVKLVSLGHIARESVEEEADRGVRPLQSVPNHGVGDLVRNQVPGVHELLGQHTELRSSGDVRPEDVTGGDLRDLVALRDELGLGALTRPARSDEDDSHTNPLLAYPPTIPSDVL